MSRRKKSYDPEEASSIGESSDGQDSNSYAPTQAEDEMQGVQGGVNRGIARSSSEQDDGHINWMGSRSDTGSWVARPYKREAIDKAMKNTVPGTDRRDAILANLKSMGVTAFIIDSRHALSTEDVMDHVNRVIGFVSKENRNFDPVFQRCLLYQDKEGLLYNIVVPQQFAGQTETWHHRLESFSAFQAMLALLVLMRSFPCVEEGAITDKLKPPVMALILGLVLSEEISLSYMNSAMMIRACPSISAYALTNKTYCDWIRKLIILTIALAGPATGKAQVALLIVGFILTTFSLLANLGSRVWYFFKWQPLTYDGPLASLYAYVTAIATGLVVPFMGHRLASVGGRVAIESIMRMAIGLTLAYIVCDFDSIRKFITVGSVNCPQDGINIFVALWMPLTLVISVWMVAKVDTDQGLSDEEPLLEEDHLSPVGYRVPSLPDFPIDPSLAEKSLPYLSLRAEIAIGFVIACGMAGAILSTAFTDWENSIEQPFTDSLF